MSKYYVLLGLPGAGKGEQGKILEKHLGLPHFSTGAMFRNLMNEDSDLGRAVKEKMDAKEYVPDELTNRAVADYLEKNPEGVIFDGYPRTVPQAEFLQDYLKEKHEGLVTLYIQVTNDTAINRQKKRGQEAIAKGEKPRSDDIDDDAIAKRMKISHELTDPLIEFYERQNKIYLIDGEPTIEEVFQEIVKKLSL